MRFPCRVTAIGGAGIAVVMLCYTQTKCEEWSSGYNNSVTSIGHGFDSSWAHSVNPWLLLIPLGIVIQTASGTGRSTETLAKTIESQEIYLTDFSLYYSTLLPYRTRSKFNKQHFSNKRTRGTPSARAPLETVAASPPLPPAAELLYVL